MAFGQPSGPPATARQLRELTALVEAAGHSGFKDARGPLGLNQSQAGGRFTQDEATELIARLEAEAEDAGGDGAGDAPDRDAGEHKVSERGGRVRPTASAPGNDTPPEAPPAASRRQSLARQLERVPEDLLVDELRRRGWTVTSP
ncbi:MAG TPA: hypothetical protein VF320_06235 [Acidimicrobiales bacterium]